MSGFKKTSQSKFLANEMSDLLNESQLEKTVPKRKAQKRQKPTTNEENGDISKLIEMYQASSKKKKTEDAFDSKESRQKILDVLGQQLESRKTISTSFLTSLLDIITQLENDYEMLRENEQKLEHLANVFVKCIKQTSAAQKQNMNALKDIHNMYKKEVEGLITRGGMKPDDRPIWFDVYKKFPPLTEPKFARPKPEIKPIRQILYQEDVVRVKFNSQGHGFGAINMLNPTGETHIKKLVNRYEKLKSEGVPESELIEKSVEAEGLERQQLQHDRQEREAFKLTAKNPESATAQVLAEADIKNIFKEQ